MYKNGVMMQYFEWHTEADGQHWNRLKDDAKHLSEIGVSSVWIPPVFKGTSVDDVGYGIYDLYDLGEFDQKGTVRTKYGTKDELIAAIEELHRYDIQVYADVVLNHKAAADETERFKAIEVDPNDRNKAISDPYEIEAWTKFTFPGRKGKYSDFTWNYHHFSGTDYDQKTDKKAIFMIVKEEDTGWAEDWAVNNEFGNYDYLMFADIDYDQDEVKEEVIKWAKWFVKETGVDGFRLDAVKHIHEGFIHQLVTELREAFGDDFFVVAEYWNNEFDYLEGYLEDQQYDFDLFDVMFHYRLSDASKSDHSFDMRSLFDDTLVSANPMHSVTFVDNHDSQPGQSLESYVEPWFKPLAYSLILLREYGYPTIFYGDYYGLKGEHPVEGQAEMIDKLLDVRVNAAYGEEQDYFDHGNCIGWVRLGNEDYPDGCAVVMSNGDEGFKEMSIGADKAGKVYVDCLGSREEKITLDENGMGQFPVNERSVSVWVQEKD